ncbi:hypothetical protein LCGC14_1302450 [marine sediment metagenome]|uniref:Uncharacterized protein n=1 Tax=marine sediment metagenome TaxID=412755 RepID=A0A0F9KQI7_9ZZZZ
MKKITNEKGKHIGGEIIEHQVHEGNLAWLDKKFEKMRKVALQVGAKPPTYKILREEFKERKEFNEATGQLESKGFDKFFVITVEGDPPKLKGYGQKKSSLKLRLNRKQKAAVQGSSMSGLAADVVGFATVSRIVTLIR